MNHQRDELVVDLVDRNLEAISERIETLASTKNVAIDLEDVARFTIDWCRAGQVERDEQESLEDDTALVSAGVGQLKSDRRICNSWLWNVVCGGSMRAGECE